MVFSHQVRDLIFGIQFELLFFWALTVESLLMH